MSEKSRSRGRLYKQYGKSTQALLNSASQHFYHNRWALARKLSRKEFLLMTCKILQLLVNTVAANDKYHILNRETLKIPIQIQFSQKQQTFSQLFPAFLKSSLIFKHFEQKDDTPRFCTSEIGDSENVVI